MLLQGDPNVPAGQLTLEINLSRPVVLPDLEQQCSIEELSRLVLGIHEEVQREAEQQASDTREGACGRDTSEEEVEADHGACAGNCQPGPNRTSAHHEDQPFMMCTCSVEASAHHEDQPFVLPLGVTARNEVYPRTCRKW